MTRQVTVASASEGMEYQSPFPAKYDKEDQKALQDLTSLPTIAQVWARKDTGSDDAAELQVTLAHKDPLNDKVIKSVRCVLLSGNDSDQRASITPPCVLPDAAAVHTSPSGRRRVIVRSGTPMAVELWQGVRKALDLEIPEKVHGSLFADSFFAHGLAWSPCEQYVAYVAERPKPESKPAEAESEPEKDKGKEAASKVGKPLTKYINKDCRKEDDWGELNTKKGAPQVYVMDLDKGATIPVAGQCDSVSYGQPIWTPDGGLIMVGWPHESSVFANLKFRLGIVYCFNRNCGLWYAFNPCSAFCEADASAAVGAQDDQEAEASEAAEANGPDDAAKSEAAAAEVAQGQGKLVQVVFDPPLKSAMEPRFSPNGSRIVFISHDQACTKGTHYAAAGLHRASWPAFRRAAECEGEPVLKHTQVIGPVHEQDQESFPGLYSASLSASLLPKSPFVDDKTVLLNTMWCATATIVAVDLTTGSVTRLTSAAASYTLVASDRANFYAVESALTRLPAVFCLPRSALEDGASAPAGSGPADAWRALPDVVPRDDIPASVLELMDDVSVEHTWVLSDERKKDETKGPTVPSLVLRRKSCSGPQATALFLHGGPHPACANAFLPPLLFLLQAGYIVLMPNYRGSAGYGEGHLQALPGNIGTMDVGDCMAALEALIEAGDTDRSRVVVVGGSHGGFLTGHVAGQHPSVFKAAVMRNPVLDIRHMVNVTDIPDWCFVETLGSGEASMATAALPLTDKTAPVLLEKSPIRYVEHVEAPVMMFLGAADRRVPHSDGLAYAKAMRCLGKDVEVHLYPQDTHALDKPQTGYDQWLRIVAFFRQHASPLQKV